MTVECAPLGRERMDETRKQELSKARERLKRSLEVTNTSEAPEGGQGPSAVTVSDRNVRLDPEDAEGASLYKLARAWMGRAKTQEKPDLEGVEETQRPEPLPRDEAGGSVCQVSHAEKEAKLEGMIERWKELRRARHEAWKREQARFEPRMEQLLPDDEPSTPE